MNRNRIRRVAAGLPVAAVAVLLVAGCNPEDPGAGPHVATGVGVASGPKTPTSSTAPLDGATPLPAPVACDSASPGVLAAAASGGSVSGRIPGPVVIETVHCVDRFAIGQVQPADPAAQPLAVLFRYESGSWEAVDAGSTDGGATIDCGVFGVPADVIRRLPGCR